MYSTEQSCARPHRSRAREAARARTMRRPVDKLERLTVFLHSENISVGGGRVVNGRNEVLQAVAAYRRKLREDGLGLSV